MNILVHKHLHIYLIIFFKFLEMECVCGSNKNFQHESLPIYFLYLECKLRMQAGSSYTKHIIPAFSFRS